MEKMPLYLSQALVILLFTPIMIMAQPTIYNGKMLEGIGFVVNENINQN
jgi:hypothetical protein